jgi:hypothetical protein
MGAVIVFEVVRRSVSNHRAFEQRKFRAPVCGRSGFFNG